MKRYYNEAETPLKFHKLYHYLIIPYACLSGLLSLFDYAISPFPLNMIMCVLLSFTIASIILCAIIFLGFYSFSSYTWYCLMIFLGLSVLQAITEVCFLYFTLPFEEMYQLIYWLPDIVIPPLIALYYIKRKPLFFPEKSQAAPMPAPVTTTEPMPAPITTTEPTPPVEAPVSKGSFCVYCGKKLKDDYVFCPKCGTAR